MARRATAVQESDVSERDVEKEVPLAEYKVEIFPNRITVDMKGFERISPSRLEASTHHVIRRWREMQKAAITKQHRAEKADRQRDQEERDSRHGAEKRQ